MLYKTIIFSLVFSVLANCRAQKEVKTSTTVLALETKEKQLQSMSPEGEMIYFKEGENKFLKEYQMNVTFTEVTEDNRCPAHVKCIWDGVAVASVQVIGVTTRPVTLHLATIDNTGKNYCKSAKFNGYIISLAQLTPSPNSKAGVKALAGNYSIGITIKKTEEKSTTK